MNWQAFKDALTALFESLALSLTRDQTPELRPIPVRESERRP
ncbi:MAG: hypothetical protein SV765_10195 [Pseudomonadota bacterium]|nr:hypothetical protein [Pseudomonadota bacterium]